MKNVVTLDEIREFELRPQDVYRRYLDLLELDVPEYLGVHLDEERLACPACESPQRTPQFEKLGFRYNTCDSCGTMYVARRPSDEALQKYVAEAESHRFFVQEYLSELQAAQGSRLLLSRVNWLLDSMAEYDTPRNTYLDQRTKYPSVLERIRSEAGFSAFRTARPLVAAETLGEYVDRGPLRSYGDATISVISAFEFLDSLFAPELFARDAERVLEPGGLLFVTTRNISGFDMQVLWEKSRSILPPNHVTIFSVEGMVAFFERHGFIVRELSTPGQLDLDIVANALAELPTGGPRRVGDIGGFLNYLLSKRGKEAHQSFKSFLQGNRLSSHARMVLQKKR